MQALIHSRFFCALTSPRSCLRKTKLMQNTLIVFSRPYSQFEIVIPFVMLKERCAGGVSPEPIS
jgi:hypothetical protein